MQRTSNTLLKQEFRLLAGGNNFGKLFVLTGILGFAILSLGINDGLMEHLTAKMESPFMRLVEVQNSIGQANLDSIPLAPKFQENRENAKTCEPWPHVTFFRYEKQILREDLDMRPAPSCSFFKELSGKRIPVPNEHVDFEQFWKH